MKNGVLGSRRRTSVLATTFKPRLRPISTANQHHHINPNRGSPWIPYRAPGSYQNREEAHILRLPIWAGSGQRPQCPGDLLRLILYHPQMALLQYAMKSISSHQLQLIFSSQDVPYITPPHPPRRPRFRHKSPHQQTVYHAP